MSEAKYTPEWIAVAASVRLHTSSRPPFGDGLWEIREKDAPKHRLPIAIVHVAAGHDPATRKRAEVRAALIVRAVNCHDELLAALKGYMNILGSDDAISSSKRAIERRAKLWKQARAIIDRAESE